MYAFAFFPRSVPCATLCRKMLPVEMCGTPRYAASFAAWVPLPAPGGPSRTSLMSRRERSQRSKDFGLGVHLDWDTILAVEDPGQSAILFSAVRSPAPCNFDSREASRYAGDDDKEPKEFHGRGRDRGRCPDLDRNGPHEVRGGRSVGDNDTDGVGRRPILEELVRRGGRSDGRDLRRPCRCLRRICHRGLRVVRCGPSPNTDPDRDLDRGIPLVPCHHRRHSGWLRGCRNRTALENEPLRTRWPAGPGPPPPRWCPSRE